MVECMLRTLQRGVVAHMIKVQDLKRKGLVGRSARIHILGIDAPPKVDTNVDENILELTEAFLK